MCSMSAKLTFNSKNTTQAYDLLYENHLSGIDTMLSHDETSAIHS